MDLYAVLGVSPGADVKEIRKAYHRLAQQYHPDHNQDNPEAAKRFMEISAAWRVLRDKAARADYDRQAAEHPSGESAGARRSGQHSQQASSSAGSRSRPQAETVDFTDMAHSFERYFGFDPKTGEVTDETKLDPQAGKKNPLDTSELFERFMGFKAR